MKKPEFEKLFKTYLKKYSKLYIKKYIKEEYTNLIREEIKYALSLQLLTEGNSAPAARKSKPVTSSKIRDEFAENYLKEQQEYTIGDDYDTDIPDTLPAIKLDINSDEAPEFAVAIQKVQNDPVKQAQVDAIFNKDYREDLKDMDGQR